MTGRADTRLALKIDVDTHDGLARGVPALADLLASHGVRASFFVACGPDRMGRRLGRLLDPRFVAKLVRTRVVASYGWRTLLSGLLLPARAVAGAFPETLRRLVAEGHEVGVHGYDHARWQDRLPRLSSADVRSEVTRAHRVLRDILGTSPRGFAAPGWRCTAESLAAVDEAGFAYRSDTRGSFPFRPMAGGRVFRAPEIPTTLPTLDEVYGPRQRSPKALVELWIGLLRSGALNVHTIHAELEGGPHLAVLDELLTRAKDCSRVVRRGDEAAGLADDLLAYEVHEGAVSGRAMPVALQGARPTTCS
jgi:peptidoglycan/xylan/chitin deacetylase (PgdA/CDA1 family)